MSKYILGIDVGGTSIKALIVDEKLNQVALGKVSTLAAYKTINNVKSTTGPQRNFDGEILWKLTKEAIEKALSQLTGIYSILSIAVSSCGCTVFLLDTAGKQIDLIVSSEELEDEVTYYSNKISRNEFFEITGYPLEKETVGFHISAFCRKQEYQPHKILSVDDYITFRLTGCYPRNKSTSFSCGMWDWRENTWLELFLTRSGLDNDIMGIPKDSGEEIGFVLPEVAKEINLSILPLVCSGGHDYETAALSSHEFIHNNVMNITGTIDMLAAFSAHKKYEQLHDIRYIRDHHVLPEQSSFMVETFGAIQTEWLKKHITHSKVANSEFTWDNFANQMTESVVERFLNTEVFIPRVYGETFPQTNLDVYGAFLGLTKSTTSGELLRAMMEGMAFQTKRMLETFRDNGLEFNKLVTLGGGNKDEVVVQMKADIFGIEIIVPELEEASAVGAAMLAGIGAGLFTIEESLKLSGMRKYKTFVPNRIRENYYRQIFDEIWLPMEETCKHIDMRRNEINNKFRGAL